MRAEHHDATNDLVGLCSRCMRDDRGDAPLYYKQFEMLDTLCGVCRIRLREYLSCNVVTLGNRSINPSCCARSWNRATTPAKQTIVRVDDGLCVRARRGCIGRMDTMDQSRMRIRRRGGVRSTTSRGCKRDTCKAVSKASSSVAGPSRM